MDVAWTHAGPTILAAFLASLVEFVEALTIVLAVGAVRGWRGALGGTALGLLGLLAIVLVLGPTMTRIPLDFVQLGVGTLLLLFGMRWLRKAILRSAGVIALHDEQAAYAKQTTLLRSLGGIGQSWDGVAVRTAFNITMIEGIEVVFIVIALGAGGGGLLVSASLGAAAALLLVVALGIVLHRPVAAIPENTLKFAVGVLLCAFGTFWWARAWALPGLARTGRCSALRLRSWPWLSAPWAYADIALRPEACNGLAQVRLVRVHRAVRGRWQPRRRRPHLARDSLVAAAAPAVVIHLAASNPVRGIGPNPG